jgi:AGZA family xanthine/uracil permease-like MFS transporter
VPAKRYQWAVPGDINAFFGLMLDNIAGLLLLVGLLEAVFGFPTRFVIRSMVPGTAIGVLVGDLLFCVMAFRLARRTGRGDVTAMPLGLDTPSTFGMVFFVLGPAFVRAINEQNMTEAEAAQHAWHIGICAIFISGLFKVACAFGAHWIRVCLPRAGLLGSLAAIALVLISFLPLLEVFHYPLVGLLSLVIVLTTLVARVPLPGRLPGALGALLIGGGVYYLLEGPWLLGEPFVSSSLALNEALFPHEWLSALGFEWLQALDDTVAYLPIVIPFALATVVGGIDCTESAAAAGDDYPTRQIIGVEALATLVAAVCGGVIQTTPYIGHPAYKAMGGRAAYTLATAIFVGGAGLIGYFGYLYAVIPKATVFPILVFIGLEITAQSFQATPRRHYAAVALACVPALASLALIYMDKFVAEVAATQQFSASLQLEMQTVRVLANGFIVTSLLWASTLAALIDHRLRRAAVLLSVAAVFSLFGIIHSPLAGGAMFAPWHLEEAARRLSLQLGGGYLAAAVLLILWDLWYRRNGQGLAQLAPEPDPTEREDGTAQGIGNGSHGTAR